MKEVSCLDLEIQIMRRFDIRRNIIVPNVTNMGSLVPFETDVLILSDSNYATGFEIKISKSDLKADFKKSQHIGMELFKNGKAGMERYFGRFKYFYYAVPSFMEEDALKLIPEFCGLYSLEKREYPNLPIFKKVREAKKIFNNKWSDRQRLELARLGTMRILGLKESLNNHILNKK